ncbi:hypothetical protein Tco_1350433 [Tanacetum coccineum]
MLQYLLLWLTPVLLSHTVIASRVAEAFHHPGLFPIWNLNGQDQALLRDTKRVMFGVFQLLFYSDRLETQHIEASMNSKEVLPSKSPVHPFEKFAYVPPETNSSGWRTTKSKMRLPKRVQVSTAKH